MKNACVYWLTNFYIVTIAHKPITIILLCQCYLEKVATAKALHLFFHFELPVPIDCAYKYEISLHISGPLPILL